MGKLAPQFAATGYKVVILEGAAAAARLPRDLREGRDLPSRRASLWGLDTYAAERRVPGTHGDAGAQACVIGPAGENLVRFAIVANNKWRCLGRGGPGAVMGSKKVKGIVWHGNRKVEVARPAEFKALMRDMVQRGKTDPSAARYEAMGTVQMVRVVNSFNAFPTRYWQKGRLEDFEPLSWRDHDGEVQGRHTPRARPASCTAATSIECPRGIPSPGSRSTGRSTRRSTRSAAFARSSTSRKSCA